MGEIRKEIIIQQVLAMRAQCDALLAMYDVEATTGDGVEECPHPLDRRKVVSTMGAPERWQCQVCGYEHTEEF